MDNLINMSCKNSQTVSKLSIEQIAKYINDNIPEWQLNTNCDFISKHFNFKNFKQTMFFVNAVAYMCEKEAHHPDMRIGFNYCEINFQTHDVNGISINDIICAVKIDNL